MVTAIGAEYVPVGVGEIVGALVVNGLMVGDSTTVLNTVGPGRLAVQGDPSGHSLTMYPPHPLGAIPVPCNTSLAITAPGAV